jgi:hypothetical protein
MLDGDKNLRTTLPTRAEVISKISDLKNGVASREQVSAWAVEIIEDETLKVTDLLTWKIVKNLGAADLPSDITGFLYSIQDFDDWESELR